MRHGMNGRKFSRTSAHRKSLLMNLARSLILHDRIQTTLAKAKDLRPYVEKLVTVARENNLTNKRLLLARFMGDISVVNRLLTVVAPRCVTRNGGYVRILKNGFRKGDNAPVGLIEFVDAVFPTSTSKKERKEQKAIENNMTEENIATTTSVS